MKDKIIKFLKSLIIPLVISGLFAIFNAYINKPEYKIHELMSAIKTKDRSQFNTLVNQEIFVNNLYKTNKDKYIPRDDDDIISQIDSYLHLGIAALIDGPAREDINTVIDMYFDSKIDTFAVLTSDVVEFIVQTDWDSIKVIQVKEQSKTLQLVSFSLMNKKYNHEFIFNSVWEKHGSNWQVINITNIAQIISAYKDVEKNRKNESITAKTKEMLRSLEISFYEGTTKDVYLFNFFKIFRSYHKFLVTNKTNQTITSYGIKLTFKDHQGYATVETRETFKKPLGPHDSAKVDFWSYNPYVSSELMYGNNPDIDFTFIEYESGQLDENKDNLDYRYFE